MNWIPENLTKDQAEFIRFLRCGRTMYSWRCIAEITSFLYNGDWEDNQLAGQELCQKAANFFNEDPNKEPWN